jgi:cytochrome c oxidase subunit 2
MTYLYTILFNFLTVKLDFPKSFQYNFQDPATPVMEAIVNFHHDLMLYLILIVVFTFWICVRSVFFYQDVAPKQVNFTVHGTFIEIVWTLVPALILIGIAIPSFSLLYSMDEIIDPSLTIKVIGNQWYWGYEYATNELGYDGYDSSLSFDSYLIAENDLKMGQLRLLEVDNRLTVPIETHIRMLITSSDVLHSWAVPSLGVKLDACPGRLNQTSIYIKREGVFFGQCSEICGINHGFMPIVVDAIDINEYLHWYEAQLLMERYFR